MKQFNFHLLCIMFNVWKAEFVADTLPIVDNSNYKIQYCFYFHHDESDCISVFLYSIQIMH